MPATVYSGPDPYTTTRQEFTDHHLSATCPQDADPKFRHVFTTHQKLLKLLIEHPAMDLNRDQTYMTPAAKKNKVYFMWDFVGRTFGMLWNVRPARPDSDKWMDIFMRVAYSKLLILDDTGKLETMNQATGYNDDAGVEFTAEIKEEAEKLDDFPE